MDENVAAVGDTLVMEVEGTFFYPPNGTHVLTQEDIHLGSVQMDLIPDSASDVPEASAGNLDLSCYPNPFNPRTQLEFTIPAAGFVSLEVYDTRGALVDRLFEGFLEAGLHRFSWNGQDVQGRTLPSGLYLAFLVTKDNVGASGLVLLR
jgi:hypothetical protein